MSEPIKMYDTMLRAWTPGRFLFTGGLVLLVIGGAGLAGLLGRIAAAGFFHPPVWVDGLHLAVGALALGVAARGSGRVQLILTLVPAIAATALGIGGLLRGSTVAGAQLGHVPADASDAIVHLAVGALALYAVWNGFRATSRHPEARGTQ